jgi:hypothetical protein
MSTPQWAVRVRQVRGASCRLEIEQASPDANVPVLSRGWILMALVEPAHEVPVDHPRGKARPPSVARPPLAGEISFDQSRDKRFLRRRLGDFVTSVEIVDTSCWLNPRRGRPMSVTVAVVMTRPEWLEHLHPGMSWYSSAWAIDAAWGEPTIGLPADVLAIQGEREEQWNRLVQTGVFDPAPSATQDPAAHPRRNGGTRAAGGAGVASTPRTKRKRAALPRPRSR